MRFSESAQIWRKTTSDRFALHCISKKDLNTISEGFQPKPKPNNDFNAISIRFQRFLIDFVGVRIFEDFDVRICHLVGRLRWLRWLKVVLVVEAFNVVKMG